MQKNILILIGASVKQAHYHLALGKALEDNGHNVIYAFDDHFTLCRENLNLQHKKVFFFSDYFKENHSNPPQLDELYKSINLNKCIFPDYDREIRHYGKMIPFPEFYDTWIRCLISFFDEIVTHFNIEICINEAIANAFSYSVFTVLKAHGKSYCGYLGSRMKNRIELYTEEFCSIDKFKKEFSELQSSNANIDDKEIEDYLKSFEISSSMPSYHPKGTKLDWNFSIMKILFDKDTASYLKACYKYRKQYKQEIKFSYFKTSFINELSRLSLEKLKKYFRTKSLQGIFETPNKSDRYYLYPLHFKPEASTSVYARHFCNDLATIENISFNIPYGTKLYVKEHFVNFGRSKKSFYNDLKKIPNVKLISPDENTKQLVNNSLGVITLTSTVGYEALLMNKPVWVLGDIFYESHPNCRKIRSYDELFPKLMDTSILEDTNIINKRFLAAYKKITYPGEIGYQLWEGEYDDNRFLNSFIKAFNEYFKIQV